MAQVFHIFEQIWWFASTFVNKNLVKFGEIVVDKNSPILPWQNIK